MLMQLSSSMVFKNCLILTWVLEVNSFEHLLLFTAFAKFLVFVLSGKYFW
jgi:hypothetical protein